MDCEIRLKGYALPFRHQWFSFIPSPDERMDRRLEGVRGSNLLQTNPWELPLSNQRPPLNQPLIARGT